MQEMWVPAVDSKNVVGRFVDMPSVDVAKSREAGEEVLIHRPALQAKVVGSHDVSVQLVKPFNAKELQKRFPGSWEHYEKHVKGKPEPADDVPVIMPEVDGTPLSKIVSGPNAFLPKDRVPWLNVQGIHTVEQLAGLSDSICQNLGRDVTRWRKQSEQFLKRT